MIPMRIRPLAVVALLAPALAAQPPAKLAEWPTLDAAGKNRAQALVGQFRKPDPQLHADARKQLVALGAGAAPMLMQQISDRADNVNAMVFAVLDELVTAEHSALLAREVKKPRVELRRWLCGRLCRLRDADLAPVLESLVSDQDERTAFHAQLGLLGLRRQSAVAPVVAYTKSRWAELGPLVAEVLTPARAAEAATPVFEYIAKAPAGDQMAALRIARYLMVKEQGMLLRAYIESSDHAVKREAINAARVVHGEPPIENLSVFQAIELAKEWLKKL
jgi:hypothetical protein